MTIQVRDIAGALVTVAVAALIATAIGCGGSSSSSTINDTNNAATCLNNMHLIGMAMLQYEQDYDEQFVPPHSGAPQGWAGGMYPYLRSTIYLHCPDDPTTDDTSLSPVGVAISYGANANLQDPTSPGSPLKVAQVPTPSKTVAFFEVSGDKAQPTLWDEGSHAFTSAPPSGMFSPAGNGLTSTPQWGYAGSGSSPIRYATGPMGGRSQIAGSPRHSGSAAYVAADGHVVLLPPAEVSAGTNNPSPTGLQNTPSGAAAGVNVGSYTLTFSIQ